MTKILFVLVILVMQNASADAQLHLSAVNTGDCVAPRISEKRSRFVDELDKKSCAEHNKDKVKERKCIENARGNTEFSFFTDRCSEKDYFIGINGKEFKLSRIAKKRDTPHDFIGSFSGNGIHVVIGNSRLLKKKIPGR